MKRMLVAFAITIPMMFTGAAFADSLDFSVPIVTPLGPDFVWSYTVSIDNAEHVNTTQNSAFITLYDVNNLVGSSALYLPFPGEPTGTVSVQDVGITPSLENPVDNPAIPNITIDYSGTSGSSQNLGVLSFLDTLSGTNRTIGNFSAQATNNDGSLEANTSSVPVPAPEPTSLVLVVLGMAGLALRMFHR